MKIVNAHHQSLAYLSAQASKIEAEVVKLERERGRAGARRRSRSVSGSAHRWTRPGRVLYLASPSTSDRLSSEGKRKGVQKKNTGSEVATSSCTHTPAGARSLEPKPSADVRVRVVIEVVAAAAHEGLEVVRAKR